MPPELPGPSCATPSSCSCSPLLAAATWVATWQRASPDPSRSSATDDAQPLGYYARGTRMLVTDEQGRVAASACAPSASTSCPSEDAAAARRRRRRIRPAGRNCVGDLGCERERSERRLAARARRRRRDSQPADRRSRAQQTILTQALRFWPDTSNVESDQPVELRVGDWHFRTSRSERRT